ncbi:NAD-binding protein [Luminiphilus sp.]|jgi:2,4-dienoyl-CoA reductase-like NADH-dependent reductase (Old Yellow Enzyme family)|nr:NAD-binding protein [Luminiphilus sp.]MDC0411016.1 NAD-binding protein [Luminiphilus sp.]
MSHRLVVTPLNEHFPTLFSPLDLGGITLRNRLIHAAIVTQYVSDSRPTERLLNYYRARAAGGAAAIVTEPIAVTHTQRQGSRLRCWDDTGFDDLQRVVEVVANEGAHIWGQLQDSGRGHRSIGRNNDAIGASALPDDLSWTVPRVLSTSEIRQLIDEWAEGARRLQRAGFTGVEISAGHGHLFHQFLSPWSNTRTDEYGGDLRNRTRFLTELISAIRNTCGRSFVIALKLPGDDGVAGGIDLPMASAINGVLAENANDFDLWTWVWGAHARSLYQHLPDASGPRHPYLGHIQQLRAEHPTILSGAIGYLTDPNECEMALNDGTADVVFLGRPLITDAAFPNKAASGNANSIRYCVSCNSCWRNIIEAGALACDNNPRVGDPDERHERPSSVKHQRHVVVVGTGVSAMEAAHTAAQRGHRVTVVGNIDQVGGKTRLHAQLPGGENLSSVYDYQYLMAQQAGVRFALNREVHVEDVLALNPDVVLLATGARASQPTWLTDDWAAMGLIPSLREMGQQLINGIGRSPGRAVLVDHDHTEMTYAVAMRMATHFDQITLVTSRERIANDVSLINRQNILQRLFDLDVELICHVEPDTLDGLEAGRLVMKNVYNDSVSELSDVVTVVHASSRLPNQQLLRPLCANGLEVIAIGDCRAPRSLMAATHEGYHVASSL